MLGGWGGVGGLNEKALPGSCFLHQEHVQRNPKKKFETGWLLISYPARWSFLFILGTLHWSSIFPTSREHKNIEQLCTSWLPALLTDAIKASPVRTCVQLLTPRLLKWPEHAKNCCTAFLKPAITFTRAFSSAFIFAQWPQKECILGSVDIWNANNWQQVQGSEPYPKPR